MSTLVETAPAPLPAQFAPQPTVHRPAARARRLPVGRLLAAAAALAVAAAGAGTYLHHAAGFETTDDAYLEGHVHAVSPRLNGTVARVLVDDNARVVAGQPLVELDPADLNLAVESAAADLAQARANVTQVTAQVSRARADVDAVTARIAQNAAELTRVEVDFHRAESLSDDRIRAISTQELDAARALYTGTQAAQQSLLAQRNSAEASLAASRAQEAVAAAQVEKAIAALDNAKLQASYTILRAPVAGRIAKKNVEAGQRLQPGQPVLAVVDDDVWVVANFKESQLAHLRPGQEVSVDVDAIDGRSFTGVVDSFSPGTGARFSLLPPDNSTGNFTKVVQRVPVKIRLTPQSVGANAARLFPGLSATVSVHLRK